MRHAFFSFSHMLCSLRALDLSNNRLTWLPLTLGDARAIANLDLSFNRFQRVPQVLQRMRHLARWSLAGNLIDFEPLSADYATVIDIASFQRPDASHLVAQLDLRRNQLSSLARCVARHLSTNHRRHLHAD